MHKTKRRWQKIEVNGIVNLNVHMEDGSMSLYNTHILSICPMEIIVLNACYVRNILLYFYKILFYTMLFLLDCKQSVVISYYILTRIFHNDRIQYATFLLISTSLLLKNLWILSFFLRFHALVFSVQPL